MNQNLSGLFKIVGITALLVLLWALMAYFTPDSFLKPNNIENLMRRTALYGVLGIGVAFVIITGGIDLSIGSVVCFSGCLLAVLLEMKSTAVDQVPIESVSTTGVVVLPEGKHPFEEGKWVRFEAGKRARDLSAKVVEVRTNEAGNMTLKLDKGFTRDDTYGVLTQLFSVDSAVKSSNQVTILADCNLRRNDEVWFWNPAGGVEKRKIAESSQASNGKLSIVLNEPVSVDQSWHVALQQRRSITGVPVAMAIVLSMGILLGLLHGLLITKLDMQPFVVTLCSLLFFRSISRWMASDQMKGFGNDYEWLTKFGWDSFSLGGGDQALGIPYPFFVLGFVAIAAMVLLNMTIWGRYMKAIGRNEEAARYSGVNTDRNKVLAYVICSGLAAAGGILFALDSNSIAPSSFGNFFELYAIAAAVLGGCSLRGGEGGILGVIVGTALMQTLYNMIVLWKISAQLELAIVGIVILLGVMADEVLKRFAKKS